MTCLGQKPMGLCRSGTSQAPEASRSLALLGNLKPDKRVLGARKVVVLSIAESSSEVGRYRPFGASPHCLCEATHTQKEMAVEIRNEVVSLW